MPDQSVELEFRGKDVQGLTQDVNALADAIGRLPATYTFDAAGGRGSSRRVLPAFGGTSRARAASNGPRASSVGAVRSATSPAAAMSSVQAAVSSLAQASGGNLTSALGAAAKLAPALGGLTAVVGAATYAFDHFMTTVNGFKGASLMYGNGQANRARGVFRSVGIDDFGSVSEAFANALNANAAARTGAIRAGINPNNSLYGGDLNNPEKVLKALRFYGDPNRSGDKEAAFFNRATGGVLGDQFATLRSASGGVRQMAMDAYASKISPEQLQKAADAQIKTAILMGQVSDILTDIGGGIADLVNFVTGGRDVANKTFGPKVLDKDGNLVPYADPKKAKQDKDSLSKDKNTDALNRLTNALDGVYGGGSRTRGAFPAGWGYEAWRQGVYRDKAAFGA